MDIDKAYAEAADFDARKFDEWVHQNFELLTKRTDYPKLGYIISRLNDLGIPILLHGKSFHAEHMLWVDKARSDEAWAILAEKHGKKTLDDMPDDHPSFRKYANVRPEALDDWTGDPSRDPSMGAADPRGLSAGSSESSMGRYEAFTDPIPLPFDNPPHGAAMLHMGDLILFKDGPGQYGEPLGWGRVLGLITHDEYGGKFSSPMLAVIAPDQRLREGVEKRVPLEDVQSVMPAWNPFLEWFFGHKEFDARRTFMHAQYGSLTARNISGYLTKSGELKDISSSI